ncbi:MAG: sigma-70 family RNA polymerase sigma factor [Acidobacteria bacterium]|nr:sigma-70 family RNA polymerase sigma factor [Acidobacteriota bacterium]
MEPTLTRCPAAEGTALANLGTEVELDGELMARTAAGDRRAFSSLVDRHKDALVTYLTRLCANRQRAEDLAQDSFIRLFQAAGSYRDRGSFRGYLYRIGTNLLRSEQRREQRWRFLEPALRPMLRLAAEDRTTEPQRKVFADEAQQQVAGALAELPIEYRAPLVLFEIEGWSYQRIAEALDCREGTIKSRIHRGRQRLRRSLEGYFKGETS